jgi:hypothetical protein
VSRNGHHVHETFAGVDDKRFVSSREVLLAVVEAATVLLLPHKARTARLTGVIKQEPDIVIALPRHAQYPQGLDLFHVEAASRPTSSVVLFRSKTTLIA